MNILDNIVADQRIIVNYNKSLIPISKLEENIFFERNCLSLKANIGKLNYPSIIAEFKRRSPSKPNINVNADINSCPIAYEFAGASAVSILTNEKYFGGNDFDIQSTRQKLSIPILRKEFIIDEYQLYEAKAMGADLILLIAEALDPKSCIQLAKKARQLGLETLLELHAENELTKINEYIDFIGINNRNLKTFETSIQTSIDLIKKLPKDIIKVSESGISSEQDVINLFQVGYQAFLIGENFMKHEFPGSSCKIFIEKIKTLLDEN